MVYGLVFLAVRRNLFKSPKTFQYADIIFRKRLPKSTSYVLFSSESDKPGKEPERPTSSDGKSQVDNVVAQLKKGKISVKDITSIYNLVLSEGQYKNYTQAPQVIQKIGFAGLVPMFGIPLLTLLSGHAFSGLVFAHMTFGATILSFLGGSSWYEAISKNEITYTKLGWCIAPQIIAWTSLLVPVPVGMLMTTVGFCLSIVHDVLLTTYPQWKKSLRLVLTGGVILSYLIMLPLSIIL